MSTPAITVSPGTVSSCDDSIIGLLLESKDFIYKITIKVSENHNCHDTGTTKVAATSEDVTCCGRLFLQVREAALGKARSPTVDNRVRRTFSDSEEADRK